MDECSRLFHDDRRWADLAYHRSHSGFAQNRQLHPRRCPTRAQRAVGQFFEHELCQPAAPDRFERACREERDSTRRLAPHRQGEEHLRFERVGFARLDRFVGVVQNRHHCARLGERTPDGVGQCCQAPRLADADAPALQLAGCVEQLLCLAHGRHGRSARVGSYDAAQGGHSVGATHPIDREAGVALELPERRFGSWTEDPVDAAGVEAERAEALLQLAHVVAPQHRGSDVEQAIAQLVARFDEGTPRLGATDAIDAQPAPFLEPANCLFRRVPEGARRVASDFEPEAAETSFDVAHGLAGVTGPERKRGGHLRETTRTVGRPGS